MRRALPASGNFAAAAHDFARAAGAAPGTWLCSVESA